MAKIRRRSWKTPAGESREAWIADYKDQSGTRRLKTFTTRREADAWLVGARSEVAAFLKRSCNNFALAGDAFLAVGDEPMLVRGTFARRPGVRRSIRHRRTDDHAWHGTQAARRREGREADCVRKGTPARKPHRAKERL